MEYKQTSNGVGVPQLGYGVYLMSGTEVREYLPKALDMGYRHIDTANAYFNESAVGEVLASSSVPRDEIFLTTKLFPADYGKDDCMAAIDASLNRLQTGYVDLLLLHQPYGAYAEGWKVLERALEQGKVRSIGLSNFPQRKIAEVAAVADVFPQVMQIEINPRNNQHALKAAMRDAGRDVVFEGWYPLGHGDAALIGDPVFAEIAKKHGKTPAQVILRWHIQEGNVVFPKTTDEGYMRENLEVFDFELTADEMARVSGISQQPYYDVPDEGSDFFMTKYDYDAEQK